MALIHDCRPTDPADLPIDPTFPTPPLPQPAEDEGVKTCASRRPMCGATVPTGQTCHRGCPIPSRRPKGNSVLEDTSGTTPFHRVLLPPLTLHQDAGINTRASRCPSCGAPFPRGHDCPNGCPTPGRRLEMTSVASRCPSCGATFPTGQNCPSGCAIPGRWRETTPMFLTGAGMCGGWF